MTHAEEPPNSRQVEELRAFGDALVDGSNAPPRDDIEATMLRVQRVLAGQPMGDVPMPNPVKYSIWEKLMETNTVPVDASHTNPSASSRIEPRTWSHFPSVPIPWVGRQWPAIVNVALILVILYGLVAVFTLQQNSNTGPGNPPSMGMVNQVLYNSDDISSYPHVPESCVRNGEEEANSELVTDRSIGDWPAPEYTPAKAITHEQGEAIQETYLAYLRCEENDVTASTPTVTEAGIADIEWSSASLSYFSDRMRYNVLSTELSPAQQDELDAYRCLPRADEILASYPLPVNQPQDYAILELTADNQIQYLQFIFAPSDVYLLPDGRYGAIMGTISPAALTNPTELTSDDYLYFLAFVEEGGRYYIDEMFSVLAPDLKEPVVNRPAGSPPLTEALYRPYEGNKCIFPVQ